MLTKERLIKFDLESDFFEKAKKEWMDWFFLISKVENANKFLVEMPSFPRTGDKIYREEMIKAIGGTQRIEGSAITDEEIEEAIKKDEAGQSLQRAEQEAINSKKVYEFIIEYVRNNRDEPITEQLIKQIHTILTRDIDYVSNIPGKYRNTNITFGIPRTPSLLKTESEVIEAMEKFMVWINEEGRGNFLDSPLVKANLAHYYLTEIHPFFDGNGRTARALEAMILFKSGEFNSYCFWSLANYFSLNRDLYLERLRDVRKSSNVMPFLMFSANGYLVELERIKNRALRKIKKLMFMDYVHFLLRTKKTQKIKINERIVNLLEFICETGSIHETIFYNHPIIKGLYSRMNPSTYYRDIKIIRSLKLINAVVKEDKSGEKEMFLECNYSILEGLNYR